MAKAGVTVAEKAPTVASLQEPGSLKIDAASDNTFVGGTNMVEENDIDSEDDIGASAEGVNVSEKRRAQNVKFAAWLVIIPIFNSQKLTYPTGCRNAQRGSRRKKCKLWSRTQTERPCQYALSWRGRIRQESSQIQGSTSWSFSKGPRQTMSLLFLTQVCKFRPWCCSRMTDSSQALARH